MRATDIRRWANAGHALGARDGDVRFEDVEWARGNEDDFDACITAAALLRCCLEELPFSQPLGPTARAEGWILCSGSINLARPEATYRPIGSSTSAVTMPRVQAP